MLKYYEIISCSVYVNSVTLTPVLCVHRAGTNHPINTRVSMNHPLPGEAGPVALVKLYDGLGDTIKLNDVIEVFGVISTDPALAQFSSAESVDILSF